jgi:RimJ/RimL family protein N-acetyltransferase
LRFENLREHVRLVKARPKAFAKVLFDSDQVMPALFLSAVFGAATRWTLVPLWFVLFLLMQAPGVTGKMLAPPPNPAIDLVKSRLRNRADGSIEAVPLSTVSIRDLNATMDQTVYDENGWGKRSVIAAQLNAVGESSEAMSDDVGFAIQLRSPDAAPRVVGAVTLAQIDRELRSAEVGWWMSADVRGQGIGKAGLRLAVEGFRDAGLETLIVGTAETNIAVQRSVEWLGGVLTKSGPHKLPNGKVIDSRWYRITLATGEPPTV